MFRVFVPLTGVTKKETKTMTTFETADQTIKRRAQEFHLGQAHNVCLPGKPEVYASVWSGDDCLLTVTAESRYAIERFFEMVASDQKPDRFKCFVVRQSRDIPDGEFVLNADGAYTLI